MGRNSTKPAQTAQNSAISDDLLKVITDLGGTSFEDAKESIQKDIEREFPDFGREIPEGVYTLSGFTTVHDWVSRDGRVSHIRTAFLIETNSEGKPFELPFACLSANEFLFVPANGTEFQPACVLKHFDSPNRRNLAVLELGQGFKVKVRHMRGHHKNPYSKRIFDFNYTWAEKA